MNDNRRQHLTEAFNSIISMMLAALRARGLRALLDLPNIIMVSIYLRRLAREFTALLASIDFSNLPPAPAPQAAPAPPAQPDPAPRARPLPAAHARAKRARSAAPAHPIPATPNPPARTRQPTRHRPFVRPCHAPGPRARLRSSPRRHDPARMP